MPDAGSWCWPLQQAAAHAVGFDAPIRNRQMLISGESPPEQEPVELDGGLRLIRLNLEIGNGVHGLQDTTIGSGPPSRWLCLMSHNSSEQGLSSA